MHTGRPQQMRAGREAAERLAQAEGATEEAPGPDAGPDVWVSFERAIREYAPGRGSDIALRLCHRDGRIRAAALNAPNPPLPLVAIRCTDWVPAVRALARPALTRALAADPAGTLRLLTPLVMRLGRREQGVWVLELFSAVLRGEEAGGVLAELRDSADLPTRRFAARLTLEDGRFDVRELAARARTEQDAVASSIWTDAALAAMAADGPDDAAVDDLLAGHLPMVRAAGVTALRGAGRAAEAVEYLADRSGQVRACARWLVRQDGGDPHARYRALVEDPARVTPYAVTGFAECGRREDAPLLRALLEHPAGGVRAAAVGGLRLLDVTDLALLRPLLDDPSPAVAREASLSLCSSAGQLPADWLLARMAPGRPAHLRLAAYRLAHARGGVEGLRASVELLTDQDAVLRRLAAQRIQSLYSYGRPPALPMWDPEVGVLLDRCTHLFSHQVMNWMRSQLGLPRREFTTDGY
ncbi:HEAT repeat domain-containing protein [Streptomyces sp. NPDC059874]|uniref:HEAT repeat domain-containing protein n=1 Tax=Streptomyces sp. NPDC059874 TaxID=3346983 RepID=UPI003665069A